MHRPTVPKEKKARSRWPGWVEVPEEELLPAVDDTQKALEAVRLSLPTSRATRRFLAAASTGAYSAAVKAEEANEEAPMAESMEPTEATEAPVATYVEATGMAEMEMGIEGERMADAPGLEASEVTASTSAGEGP